MLRIEMFLHDLIALSLMYAGIVDSSRQCSSSPQPASHH